MARQPDLEPAAFFLRSGPTGMLLIHGFTGSPPEMRPVGEYLHARGLTVSAPLLPGHGTSVEDMNRCQWIDWTDHAEEALLDLQAQCQDVFVAGLSMGSLITIHLAACHDLQGAILYSPAVKVAEPLIHLAPLLKHLIPQRAKSDESDYADPAAEQRTWSYEDYPSHAAHELLKLMRRARRMLPDVTCPLLIVHSTGDQAIAPDSARYAYAHAGSRDKEIMTLEESGHVITVDREWTAVSERTYAFIQSHSSARD